MHSACVTADILNVLSNCEDHKMHKIAEEVEVSVSTVKRHIKALSYKFFITTWSGGEKGGGVRLEKNSVVAGRMLTVVQVQILLKSLMSLQDDKCMENEINERQVMIERFTTLLKKRRGLC